MIDKFPWLGLYHKSLKELPASSNQPVSAYTSRVSQIDAELLDNEIENHLLTVVWEAFVPFKVTLSPVVIISSPVSISKKMGA